LLDLVKAFKRYKQNYALASLFWTIWYFLMYDYCMLVHAFYRATANAYMHVLAIENLSVSPSVRQTRAL